MVDPVGAPTFASMFSPAKSPFHAISLAALICIAVVHRSALSGYGTGLALLILVGSSFLAPAFRPNYTNRVYGISLMYGRSAGLIGALLSIMVLVGVAPSGGETDKSLMAADSDIFKLLWFAIVFQTVCMAALFGFKTKTITDGTSQFNVIQFCLMHTTLLIFVVTLARLGKDFGTAPARNILSSGIGAIMRAPLQIFTAEPIDPRSVVYALMLLWCLSGIINGLMLAEIIERGWVVDHGDADNDYSKS